MAFFSKVSTTFLSVSLLSSFGLAANQDALSSKSFSEILQERHELSATKSSLDSTAKELWDKFLSDTQTLEERKAEHSNKALAFKDKTMKFSMDKIGSAGANGYPLYIALHGGGGAASWVNDSQWEHMKIYYKDSVENGVYVAARGVTDTWDLHNVPESYPLYERLIENMVLFEGVDPNRVYLLGFSAGGDGVYQVVPRMADRFAAGNMSAGHNNGIKFDNLYNTPFVLQVGEYDSMYNRNTVTAENYLLIQDLKKQHGGGYVSDLFVHSGMGHNGWPDNSAARQPGVVIANPQQWLENQDRTTKTVNTNAVDWLNQHSRTAVPQKVVWDLTTSATRTKGAGQALLTAEGSETKLAVPHELFYWLDVSVANEFPAEGKLVAEFDRSNNSVSFSEVTNVETFRVLLNTDMVDFSKPVSVSVSGQNIGTIKVSPSLETMTRTLLERADKNFIFDADFTMKHDAQNGHWTVSQ